jgi:hypothetical protein
MEDKNTKRILKKLENQLKVLKMKLQKAKLETNDAYLEGFGDGFDEGRAYQMNEIELGLFEQEGPSH